MGWGLCISSSGERAELGSVIVTLPSALSRKPCLTFRVKTWLNGCMPLSFTQGLLAASPCLPVLITLAGNVCALGLYPQQGEPALVAHLKEAEGVGVNWLNHL